MLFLMHNYSIFYLQVGVGTCNVGGKGMTDFDARKKYSKS